VKRPNRASEDIFPLSIKPACLNRILPLGERLFRLLVNDFDHYHIERTQQAWRTL
jgi:hypothetical protein